MAVQERARLLTPRAALAPLAAAALLAACGGGGGGEADDSAAAVTLPGVAVSGTSPVPAGCNGGRASGTVFADAEAEPFVAVSPAVPQQIVGIWQQDRASDGGARAIVSAWSADGGRSWSRTLHPFSRCGGAPAGSAGDAERASDPWVDIGPDGTVHAMALAFGGSVGQPGVSSAMLASRSTDGGRTWSPPQVLQRDGSGFFNDKNTLTADPTDARFVYAVWDRLDEAGNGPTMLARSTDGGSTWEPARPIVVPSVRGGVSQTLGNRIVVVADGPQRGTLALVYTQIDTVGRVAASRLRVARSTDRGQTWGEPVTVAEMRAVGTRDPQSGTPVRDGALVPAVATGPGGRIWVAWQDARFNGGLHDAIALARSDDAGASWSAPLAVNRDLSVPAFTPTLQVLPDGRLAVTHLDLRSNTADASTLPADLWLLTTRDGGTVTEQPLARAVPLHAAPSVAGGLFLGDYHGLASTGGNVLLALVALPTGDAANRTEVVAIRTEVSSTLRAARTTGRAAPTAVAPPRPDADAATFRSRPLPVTSPPGGLDDAALAKASSAAILRVLQARPGRRVSPAPGGAAAPHDDQAR